jgi:hypothetical protein
VLKALSGRDVRINLYDVGGPASIDGTYHSDHNALHVIMPCRIGT